MHRRPVKALILSAIVLVACFCSVSVFAAPSPRPCGTNGALTVSTPTPASITYVQTNSGSTSGTFTVSSPSIQVTGSCDATLPPVFGNGNGVPPTELDVTVAVVAITDSDTGLPVSSTTLGLITNALSLSLTSFILSSPGTGSQEISFIFTNDAAIPVGEYDITIQVAPETGVGVGTPGPVSLVLTVTAPVVVDTRAPVVQIQSPVDGASYYVNGVAPFRFTANDLEEGGAGTGIQSVGGAIQSQGGTVNEDLTSYLAVSPTLTVGAGINVSAALDLLVSAIGTFTLTAEATDLASPTHTGTAQVSFTVKAQVSFLPPISVPGRQFKASSTLPIKWVFKDADGAFLSPFDSVMLKVKLNGSDVFQAIAGSGAANIRWDVDTYGNAIQYITNFPIPDLGTYLVEVYVNDADGIPMLQGTYQFLASTKGGK
jgi:hypothetical protein